MRLRHNASTTEGCRYCTPLSPTARATTPNILHPTPWYKLCCTPWRPCVPASTCGRLCSGALRRGALAGRRPVSKLIQKVGRGYEPQSIPKCLHEVAAMVPSSGSIEDGDHQRDIGTHAAVRALRRQPLRYSSVTMLSELWHRSFVSGGKTQRLHIRAPTTALSDPIPVFIARCALSSFSK